MFQHRTRAQEHCTAPNLACCLLAVGTRSAWGKGGGGCSRCAKAEGTRSFFALFQPLLIEMAAGWWSAHGKNLSLFLLAPKKERGKKKKKKKRGAKRAGEAKAAGLSNAGEKKLQLQQTRVSSPFLGSGCSPVGSSAASASRALHKSCTLVGTLNSRRPPCRLWPRSSGWSWSASGACAAPRTRQRSGPGCHPECSGRSSWQSPGRPLQRVHPFLH